MNKWTMTPSRKAGAIPRVRTKFSPSMKTERADAGQAAEPVSRDQTLRRERGQETHQSPRINVDPEDLKHSINMYLYD